MTVKSKYVTRLSEIVREYLQYGGASNEAKQLLKNYHIKINSEPPYKKQLPIHHTLDSKKTVYANNYLNLTDVKVVGFDLDYTLVTYTDELQNLIYSLAKENLIKKNGFPKSLQDCMFDKNFAIRGLTIDAKTGMTFSQILLRLVFKQCVSLLYS